MALRTAVLAAVVTLLAPACANASDLIVPAVGHERGTAMLIHGGAWASGTPARELANARAFAASGWRAVSVDYPLLDIEAAFHGIEDASVRLGARRGPLIAIGESAGGTMAEWLAAGRRVDAAVAVDAPANLTTWNAVKLGQPLAWIPLAVRGFTASSWALSPARVYRAETAAPLLVFAADDDQLVEPAQGQAMQALGAELRSTPGQHLVSLAWRRPAAAFLRRAVPTRP